MTAFSSFGEQVMSRNLLVAVGFATGLLWALPAVAQQDVARTIGSGQQEAANGQVVGRVIFPNGASQARVLLSLTGPSGTELVFLNGRGDFRVGDLVPGRYLLRTHLTSIPGISRSIEVVANSSTHETVVLGDGSQTSSLVQLAGFDDGVDSAHLSGAGVDSYLSSSGGGGQTETDESDENDVTAETVLTPHDHRPQAWRLRRARRSILKNLREMPAVISNAGELADSDIEDRIAGFDKSASTTANPLSRLLGGAPMSGEVQFLTRTTVNDLGQLWSRRSLPGQVAYLSLLPVNSGDWAVQGTFDVSTGVPASWAIAGQYVAGPVPDHSLQLAMSYSKQSYLQRANLQPSVIDSAARDALAREVGSIDADDTWSVSQRMVVDYGATFSRYGYLEDGVLLSPRAGAAFSLFGGTRARVSLEQKMTAPGAEQFLPPMEGVWLPPERTFTSLSRFDELEAERTGHVEVGLEQRVTENGVFGVTRFNQNVSNQLITMFSTGQHVPLGTLPAAGGHYYLTSANGVSANGWEVSYSHASDGLVSGEVNYSYVRSGWLPGSDSGSLPMGSGLLQFGRERFHDVTTTVEAEIPKSSTRVIARCRVNTAFTGVRQDGLSAGLDARFDIRIMQTLPFSPVEGSEWELLLALRSLYYDPLAGGSMFDELLVVDPPRQFIGGLVVNF